MKELMFLFLGMAVGATSAPLGEWASIIFLGIATIFFVIDMYNEHYQRKERFKEIEMEYKRKQQSILKKKK